MMRLFFVLAFLCYLMAPAIAEETKCEETQTKVKEESLRDKLPPIKSGFLIDLDPTGRDGFFYFGLELKSWTLANSQRISVDAGVASSRVLLGLGWGTFFEGNVGPFLWAGYNIAENAPAWGIGLNMLKL
jgi:hypothetical protein